MNDFIADAHDNSQFINEGCEKRIRFVLEALTEKYISERIHSLRVSSICEKFGKVLQLSKDDLERLVFAAMFHDIGKVAIANKILDKTGSLNPAEYEMMKEHTLIGYNILSKIDCLKDVAKDVLHHHERYDGTGYPFGLKGNDIPYISRIISIVDAFEAMTSDRIYRKKISKEEAKKELNRCKGTQFDPDLVDIFIKNNMEDE